MEEDELVVVDTAEDELADEEEVELVELAMEDGELDWGASVVVDVVGGIKGGKEPAGRMEMDGKLMGRPTEGDISAYEWGESAYR